LLSQKTPLKCSAKTTTFLHYFMPITTKPLAKASIPKSKSKGHPKKANATRTKNRKGKKRKAVSSDEDEGEEDSDDSSADSEIHKKKKVSKKVLKKVSKRRHVSETDDEIEMIDEDVAPQEKTVEEVDAEGSEQTVCKDFYWEMHMLTNF
jgi:hypothetical protein